jgi:putative Mn2+ efflux pump MntP
MLIDAILAFVLVAMVGVPIVIAFDRAKKEMESEDEQGD